MTRQPERLPIEGVVSEDEAYRVLARAVQLDARLASQVSIAQLRQIAQEAGIAPAAFEEALREFRVEQAHLDAEAKPGLLRSILERTKQAKWGGLTSNLVTLAPSAGLRQV
jgi:hypothetical protein